MSSIQKVAAVMVRALPPPSQVEVLLNHIGPVAGIGRARCVVLLALMVLLVRTGVLLVLMAQGKLLAAACCTTGMTSRELRQEAVSTRWRSAGNFARGPLRAQASPTLRIHRGRISMRILPTMGRISMGAWRPAAVAACCTTGTTVAVWTPEMDKGSDRRTTYATARSCPHRRHRIRRRRHRRP